MIIYFDGGPLPHSAFAEVVMGVFADVIDCYAVRGDLAVGRGWQN